MAHRTPFFPQRTAIVRVLARDKGNLVYFWIAINRQHTSCWNPVVPSNTLPRPIAAILRFIPIIWWTASSAVPADAALLFVSPNGSNFTAGNELNPWRTLQYAAQRARPGDTVRVLPGSYVGFELETSGTLNAPIVFAAEPGVVITEPNRSTPDGINLEGASYVVIDGFEVVGMPRAGIRAVGSSQQHSRFVTIQNNRTDNNGRWGIFTGYSDDLLIEHNETSRSVTEHGIYVSNSADRPTIRHNVSWGNRASGIQLNADGTLPGDGIITDALIAQNRIFDNGNLGGAGLNLDGVQQARIENNLLYDNHATGIAIFRQDGSDGSKNNVIVNNTVVNANDARWALTMADGSTGNQVLNNILFSEHSFRGGMDVRMDSLAGLVSDYNVLEDRFTLNGGDSVLSLAEWRRRTGQDQNSLVGNPAQLFIDPTAGNYHLSTTSRAIDAGTDRLAPMTDLDGKRRPIGNEYDMGAFEFGTTVPLQAGDADQDLDFDQFDLIQVQQAAKYFTGQPTTWGEGEWNGAPGGFAGNPPAGDGLFNQLDIVAALRAGTYLTGPYAAIKDGGSVGDARTSVVYNPATGEVSVDSPAGTELTSINIDSAAAIFSGEPAQNLGGSFDNDADNNIFKATFGSSFGSLSFGTIAQSGLSQAFVINDLTVIGSLAGGGDLGQVDLVYVPEPAAIVLAIFGVLGAIASQRWCSSETYV